MKRVRFECPHCGKIRSMLEVNYQPRNIKPCSSCGRKGRFRVLSIR